MNTDLSILEKLSYTKHPVGIKFLFEEPKGIKKLDKKLAMCLMPEEARANGAFYVDNENFECAEPLFLGIHNDDPFAIAGQIGTKAGLDIFQKASANRRIYEVLPTLKPGSCNYIFIAPIAEMEFEADVLLLTGDRYYKLLYEIPGRLY